MLLEIARNPERSGCAEVAEIIGITEQAVQGIVADLHEAGYLTRDRVGRRNRYQLNLDQHFRHHTEAHAPGPGPGRAVRQRRDPTQDPFVITASPAGPATASPGARRGRRRPRREKRPG